MSFGLLAHNHIKVAAKLALFKTKIMARTFH
jgi:hypothetical protein